MTQVTGYLKCTTNLILCRFAVNVISKNANVNANSQSKHTCTDGAFAFLCQCTLHLMTTNCSSVRHTQKRFTSF